MKAKTDLLIIGSGSTAFAAALTAQQMGKTAIMTEERSIGGTCVNRGCLPSKNLIEAAKLVHDASNPRYPGLHSGLLKADFKVLIDQKRDVVESYRKKKYESLVDGSIQIKMGHASFIDADTIEISGERISGEKVLIAGGSRPAIPEIKGLDRIDYLTSDLLSANESGELTELPESLLIIGGGYIALELGQMFHRFGTKVTMLERGEQLLAHGYEPQLGRSLQEIFREEGITVITDASIKTVWEEDGHIVALVMTGNEILTLRAEKLLVAAGRRPNTDSLALDRCGVENDARGAIVVDQFLRTSVPHIFAAGDVIGLNIANQMATPVGSHDGGIAARNAFSEGTLQAVDHRVIPRCIFTDPQVAVVGITEMQAEESGYPCWCNTIPLSLVPRAGAIRDTRGLIKMVANAETEEVLGVSMVGVGAGEVIHEAAMGLRFHAKVRDFVDMIHVYPTMAEALKIVAISKYKDPEKLSCCAE